MQVIMIACDNPLCTNTDWPAEGGTKRKPKPPHGWLELKGGFHGTGPSFDLVVCSLTCLPEAIQKSIQDELDQRFPAQETREIRTRTQETQPPVKRVDPELEKLLIEEEVGLRGYDDVQSGGEQPAEVDEVETLDFS